MSISRKLTAQDLEKNLSQISRNLRSRLSDGFLRKPISQQKFAEFLSVTWSTVWRWEKKRNLPHRRVIEKIWRLHLVLQVLEDKNVILKEKRLKFFYEPNS